MTKAVRITARVDGRGGGFVARKNAARYAGQTVRVGSDLDIKVTSDGRINIPKRIMEKYGVPNADGRKEIDLQIGGRGTKLGARISRPGLLNI